MWVQDKYSTSKVAIAYVPTMFRTEAYHQCTPLIQRESRETNRRFGEVDFIGDSIS
jgi:hypothetical protein